MLILEGEAPTASTRQTDGVVFSEFSQRKVLRCFDLPDKIDVDHVEAQLQDGIIEVIAAKRPAKAAMRKRTSGVAWSEARRRRESKAPSAKGRKTPDE
jgi:HSP20 family molecular chaperone IbpA